MKWPMLPLDKVADVFGGSTPRRNQSKFWDGNIPWVTPTDLPMPGKDIADVCDTADHITSEGLKSCAAKLLPEGTVLYSSRATIGKIGIARVPLATNQGFVNFVPKTGVISKYLAYALQSYTQDISYLAGSTTFKEVSRGALRKYKIPLPSPCEQQRIVELLDQADSLRKKRIEANEKAASILPALFYKMFGDPVMNPKGWTTKRIGEVCRIVSGATPRTDQPEYWGGGISWATPKDISILEGWILERTERTLTDEGLANCSSTIVPENTVLLSSRAPIGLVAIAGKSMCTNQGFKSLVCNDLINHWYLFSWCKLRTMYLKSLGRGATFTEISKQIVESINLPIPPLKIQIEFSDHVLNLHEIYNQQRKELDQLEITFQTLLRRAFTGGLTAKWREIHMKELLIEMEEQAKALNMKAES